MAALFLDTSALVKLYVEEVGTERMLELANDSVGNQLVVLSLTRVEFCAAVRRRAKLGDLTSQAADGLIAEFKGHWSTTYLVQPMSERTIESACEAIDRHSLRAYDAMQYAGFIAAQQFLKSQEIVFVSSDKELLSAMRQDGYSIIDPCVN